MCDRDSKCCMCGTSEADVLNLGEMKTCKDYNVHYYCLLLCTTMVQNGADDEGILGFLPSDIRKELIKSRNMLCHYCRKPGASVRCVNSKCKLVFHLPCGIKNKSSHQFHKEYKSYCHKHRRKQRFAKPKDPHSCPICYDLIDFTSTDVLWAPCCKKRSFFHRVCLQQMALSAGYFFKCPICNNSEIFQTTMKNFGVFIPDRDASWELEPNAFHDLLYRHNECNAEVCQSKKGRKYYANVGLWAIVLCSTCGSQGTHVFCSNLRNSRNWSCAVCTSFSAGSTTATSQEGPSTSLTISTPSTSRNCLEIPITACENNSSSLNGSDQGKKRKKEEEIPNTPSISLEPAIVIDSDSDDCDVSVEEDEPAYKCLLVKDGKVLQVRNIVKEENNVLVQRDLNISENSEPAEGLMNIKISDVRSLQEPVPTSARPLLDSPLLTSASNCLVQMNKGMYVDNACLFTPESGVKHGKNVVNLTDNRQGNVFILKENLGYQFTKTENNVIEDQKNPNTWANEIVVID